MLPIQRTHPAIEEPFRHSLHELPVEPQSPVSKMPRRGLARPNPAPSNRWVKETEPTRLRRRKELVRNENQSLAFFLRVAVLNFTSNHRRARSMRPPVGIESPAAPISFAVFVSFRRIGADVFLRLASHHSSRLTRLRALAKCPRGGVGQFRQEVLSGRVSGAIRPCPFWRFDQISSSVTSAAALRHWFPQQFRLSAKFRRNQQVLRLIPSTTVPLAAAESSNQPCTLGNLPAPVFRSFDPDCEWRSQHPGAPGSRNSRPR